MNLVFADQAWEDYLHWQETDRRVQRRIHELIKDALRHPFTGLGKPEPLRHALNGWWSRRVTDEHRMVCRVSDRGLEIAQLRYHYA